MYKSSRTKPNTKLALHYQNHRHIIGNHINWQDSKQGSQKDQDSRVQRLARHPGLHTGNMHKHNATGAMVQLLAILNSAQISNAMPAINVNKNKIPTVYTNIDTAITEPSIASKNTYIDSQKFIDEKFSLAKQESQKAFAPFYFRDVGISNNSKNLKISSLKKRSISARDNIVPKIFTLMGDSRFDSHLRNTLDIIFRLSEQAPEVRYAPKKDKNIFILLKCIQQMHFFVIKNKQSGQGAEMLAALINIADELDSPLERTLVQRFKEQYISVPATDELMSTLDTAMPDISQKMELVGDAIVFSSYDKARIKFKEQTRLIDNLLRENYLIGYKPPSSSFIQINWLVDYLAGENTQERLNVVVQLLLKPLDKHGSIQAKELPDEYKMSVMADYLNQAILGMSLDEWCVRHLTTTKFYNHLQPSNGYLQLQLYSFINRFDNKGELSVEARAFYKDNVIKKSLPSLMLQLDAKESEILKNMNITQPRWGFIHAGAMLLSDSGASLDGLTLTDIEDSGVTLNAMLSQGLLAQEYAAYFKLPALFHYAGVKTHFINFSSLNEQDMQAMFLRYFTYLKNWQRNNNPFMQLPYLINTWETRPELAKEFLLRNGISDEWEARYLNSHGAVKIASKTLPNIDQIFEEQNRKLAESAYKVDKLLLAEVFNALIENEQEFIALAKIDRVRIHFNAQDSINKVPLSHYSIMGMVQADALIYRIPDRIDLLACTVDEVERIYALEISKKTHKYTLTRVDREREVLLWLLDDFSVPSRDKDYKIKVTSHYPLKKSAESPHTLIDNLAHYHRKELLKNLNNQGYGKTTQEKIRDFLLSLIPFHTCITESSKGNHREAIPACVIDAVSMIPFAGKAAQVGLRFGTALGGTTAVAFRYGARQAAIKEMAKHSSFIASEISPKVVSGLGGKFLNGLDPSFGLLSFEGAKGVRVIQNILSKLQDKTQGLTKLSDALEAFKHRYGGFEAKGTLQKLSCGLCDSEAEVVEEVIKKIGPGLFADKNVVKHRIADSFYIHYYTKLPNNPKASEILVVSAHGGFAVSDKAAPAVVLPSDITIKLLSPHTTMLVDPGLKEIVNVGKHLRAYMTIINGRVTHVNFYPQKRNPLWQFDENYDPGDTMNTLGRQDGLQNYRHARYERESDKLIAKVLIENRRLAEKGQAILTDILTVNEKIKRIIQTSLERASIQRILDLDRENKLLNENGERYKTIIFCHCRCDFYQPQEDISSYFMGPVNINNPSPKGSTISEVTLTRLHREDINKQFKINHYSLGRFMFIPIKQSLESTATPATIL